MSSLRLLKDVIFVEFGVLEVLFDCILKSVLAERLEQLRCDHSLPGGVGSSLGGFKKSYWEA
jgi:hypothetical protein